VERQQEAVEHARIVNEVKMNLKICQDVFKKQVEGLEEDNRHSVEANASIQVLRSQNSEYHAKCKHFQNDIDDLILSHRAEVEELTRNCASTNEELQKAKRERRQMEIEKERLKRDLGGAQALTASRSDETNALAMQIAALKVELNDSRSTLRRV